MRYAKLFFFQKIQCVFIEYYLSTFGVCVPDGQVKCRNPRSVGIIDPLEECLAGPGHDLLRNSAVSQTGALYTLARGLAVLESLISLLPLTFLRLVASVMTPHMSHHIVTVVTNHSQCSAIITLPRWHLIILTYRGDLKILHNLSSCVFITIR